MFSVEVSGPKTCSSNHCIRSESNDRMSYQLVNICISITPRTCSHKHHTFSAAMQSCRHTVTRRQKQTAAPSKVPPGPKQRVYARFKHNSYHD